MSTRRRNVLAFLLSPGLIWILLLYVIPAGLIITYSFLTRRVGGGVTWNFTLDSYSKLFGYNPDAVFINDFMLIFLRTFWWGGLTTLICLLMGYPLAF